MTKNLPAATGIDLHPAADEITGKKPANDSKLIGGIYEGYKASFKIY